MHTSIEVQNYVYALVSDKFIVIVSADINKL